MRSVFPSNDLSLLLASALLALSSGACGSSDSKAADFTPDAGSDDAGNDDDAGDGDESGDGDGTGDGDGDGDGGDSPGNPPATIVEVLPDGFTPGTEAGGYQVVGPLQDFEEPEDNSCANVLRAVIRDFRQEHIDFGEEKPADWVAPGLYTGQVLDMLGQDRKPQLNPARTPLDVIEGLGDWYATQADINEAYVMDFWLEPDPARPGTFVFDMNNFFPLDDFNQHPEDVQQGGEGDAFGPHNFLFTTEIHTAFEYKAGQVFSFRGDDDVFVYIDGKLVVDLGGIHGPVEGSVDLDAEASALGLVPGMVYTLDLFQAERNPGGSNFRIDTSLDFKSCEVLVDIL